MGTGSAKSPPTRRGLGLVAGVILAAAGVGVAFWLARPLTSVARLGPRPDGPLAFVASGPESGLGVDNLELYVAAPRGQAFYNLTSSLAAERDPAWSRDGRKVAFLATSLRRAGDGTYSLHDGVYVMNVDGTDLREILSCEKSRCPVRDLAWAPDGRRLAFVEASLGSGSLDSVLVVMDADGTGRRELCRGVERCGQGIASPTWSPDGTSIVFSNQGVINAYGPGLLPSPILVADVRSGAITRLTNLRCIPGTEDLVECGFDSGPAWSPDGNRIAFGHVDVAELSAGSRLEVINVDGSDRTTLATCRGAWCPQMRAPQWSPDGASIALVGRFDRPIVTMVSATGGKPREVRTCAGKRCVPPSSIIWSPSGQRLAFIGEDAALYVIGAAGGGMRKVAPAVYDCCLVWLPRSAEEALPADSRTDHLPRPKVVSAPPVLVPGLIAFASDRTSPYNEDHFEIYTMRSDGTGVTRVTGSTRYNVQPAWSSDGTRIAFAGDDGGPNTEIFVMNSDGRGLRRLTSLKAGATQPAWSPDGSVIAFLTEGGGAQSEVFVMAPDGTGVRRVTDTPHGASGPQWSPDGSLILFEAFRRDGEFDLYTVAVRTGKLRRVTTLPGSESDPAWSPDGSTIAFVWITPAGEGIYLMDSDATRLRRLPNAPGGYSPSWSPDGSKIAFQGRDARRRSVIYVIGVNGSHLSVLLADEANTTDPAWQPAGS